MLLWGPVALVLLSAALHLGWNAFLKSEEGSPASVWWLVAGAALSAVIGWAAGAEAGTVPALGRVWGLMGNWWPWILATVGAHALYFTALGTAYRKSALWWTYPLARGLGVLLTLAVTVLIWHVPLTPLSTAGVIAMVAAIIVMNIRATVPLVAIGATALVGAMITVYTVADSRLVHHLSPVVVLAIMFVTEAGLLAPWGLRRSVRLPGGRAAGRGMLAGLVSYVSYLLMLYAYRLGPAAPLLALRQVAPALGPMVGALWLRERPRWWQFAGGAVIAVSAVLIIRS
jgi:drug/metabolite transporter (DMT)-like permease